MPMVEVNGDFGLPVAYQGKQFTSRIHGATTDYLLMFNRTVVEGRFYTEEEVLSGARVAVIGPSIVENLFADVYPLGKEIRIDNLTLHVIGILNDAGVSGFGMQADMDALVLTPITTAQMRLMGDKTVSGERPVSAIMLKARDDDSVELVAHQARLTLRDAHHILFRDEDDFEIVTQQDLLVSVGSIMSILTVFLGVIAGVSLLVGGIGIMNIMLVTVTERTHEIGLRKAVGAQKFAILLQFLTEAMVLAVMGGLIGVSIALGLAYLVSQAGVGLDVQVQVSSILLATSISIMIGVFFGLYPARRAANLNPIDALRYE
jgi:putative ABC transport system permease protein